MLPDKDVPERYDYSKAGFDPFLSRSIDATVQSLSMDVPRTSKSVAFDRSQVSGALGDTLRVGRWHIDGVTGRQTLYDESGENRVAVLGNLEEL